MRKPILLKAPLKDYLWGGTLLKEEYGKESDLRIPDSSHERREMIVYGQKGDSDEYYGEVHRGVVQYFGGRCH